MKNLLIKWNDIYSSGNERIDKEHKEFVDIINKLFNAFSEGVAQEEINSSLARLENYSINHFEFEENYLSEIHYPNIESHKKSHSEFITKVKELKSKIKEGNTNSHYELIDFMKSWFNEHIVREAQKFSNLIS